MSEPRRVPRDEFHLYFDPDEESRIRVAAGDVERSASGPDVRRAPQPSLGAVPFEPPRTHDRRESASSDILRLNPATDLCSDT